MPDPVGLHDVAVFLAGIAQPAEERQDRDEHADAEEPTAEDEPGEEDRDGERGEERAERRAGDMDAGRRFTVDDCRQLRMRAGHVIELGEGLAAPVEERQEESDQPKDDRRPAEDEPEEQEKRPDRREERCERRAGHVDAGRRDGFDLRRTDPLRPGRRPGEDDPEVEHEQEKSYEDRQQHDQRGPVRDHQLGGELEDRVPGLLDHRVLIRPQSFGEPATRT